MVLLTSTCFVQTLDCQETTNEKSKTVYMWGVVCAADKIGKVESAEISALDQVTGYSMRIWGHTASLHGCHSVDIQSHLSITSSETMKSMKNSHSMDIESIIAGPHPE